MKKLKPWQIALLVIFYPIGIIYLIIWLINKKKQPAAVEVDTSNLEVIKEFHSNVVASTYMNEDGTSRQTYIAYLKEGDDLFFKPAPTKEYPDSIGVFTKEGGQIGVVNYAVVNEMRGLYTHNKASVTVGSIIHSERGLGVGMHIKVYK